MPKKKSKQRRAKGAKPRPKVTFLSPPAVKKAPPRIVNLGPAEIPSAERERAREVVRRLKEAYPDARVMLDWDGDPWRLLVATILAAQCTDAKVNETTPGLFAKFPTPEKMSKARLPTLEKIIRPTGFFRNKSKSVKGASQAIVERFGGELPRTMEDMLTLPGVARKTANVVLANALGVNSGVVVDTHNVRLSGRLGFVKTTDALKIESFWLAGAAQDDWPLVGHLLYCHGQQVCTARKPDHAACCLRDICPSAEDA
ncbi:MAG: endonuclease III domain-containing protein [Planctomycetota bacterium]|jgi:endonuclease-3